MKLNNGGNDGSKEKIEGEDKSKTSAPKSKTLKRSNSSSSRKSQ
jgi:hypothetical protein